MDSRCQLKFHNYRKHPVVLCDDTYLNNDDASFDQVETQLINVPPIVLQSRLMQEFISHSVADGMLLSLRRFVSSACFASTSLQLDVVEDVPVLETFMVLIISRLVFRIGSVNQELLSLLLSVFVRSRPTVRPSSLPITVAQIKRVITNASSRTSICSTMPTPRPVELHNRHAYLGLSEIIGHALGLQPAVSVILEKYQRLVNSPCGQNCLTEANAILGAPTVSHLHKMICYLTFWFDGWDPNSSMTKANKSPIWSGTVTLIFVTTEGQVKFATTRLAANGPGKADHTEVIQCILDDILSMQNSTLLRQFWVRRLLAHALIYPIVLLATCDQPERRSICGLLAGNSKLHACFGITCSVALLAIPLEACPTCVSKLNAYILSRQFNTPFVDQCKLCLQWNLPDAPGCNPKYKYNSIVDKQFPGNAIAGAHLNTHAGMLTTALLRRAWNEAYQQWVVHKSWTGKNVEAYFKVLTINDSTTDKFLAQGRRCQIANAYREDPFSVGNESMQSDLIENMTENPSDYTPLDAPPMWSLIELDQLPEAVMHLAMGVVKAVSKFVHGWAASRNKSPYLAERMNFCINMHGRYCRIGRCPMATYSALGKFPGWVADTFRSWWIWMPWLYSILDNNVFTYRPYLLPTIPPKRWNGMVCGQFLKSIGYPGYTKLKAKEKQKVVLDMSERADWPPPPVVDKAFLVSGEDLQSLIWHCHSLFKYLFAAPHNHHHRHAANGHVKLLLSVITRLDRLMQDGDDVPNLYEVKYNFISLPRAVRLLDIYGSARNIQEGGTDGEGVVKMLRPLTPSGLKQHFSRNLINAFHRDQQLSEFCTEIQAHTDGADGNGQDENHVMRLLLDQAEQSTIEDDIGTTFLESDNIDDDVSLDGQQYKKYKSINQLTQHHSLGLPLSFVIANVENDSLIGFVVGNQQILHLIPVSIGKVVAHSVSGFAYFLTTINLDQNTWVNIGHTQEADDTNSFVNYGHLLPHLASIDHASVTGSIPYAVVSLDANYMNETYEFI